MVDPALPEDEYHVPEHCGLGPDGWFREEHRGSIRFGAKVRSVLHEERSEFQKVTVYDTEFFGRMLTLDDMVMLTELDEFVYHELLTHIPLLAIESPRTALVVGGGDTGIAREILRHPTIEQVVLCEIDERVTRVSERFFPWVPETLADPRLELVFGDGVETIRAHDGRFDLIVVDSTDPIGPAAALFTEEFYRTAARALRPEGILTAQTESPHWDSPVVGAIYAQLRGAFRHAEAYLGTIPTYPSGLWSFAYATNRDAPHGYFDAERAAAIAERCRYYTPELQSGAFVLPAFVRAAVEGRDIIGGGRRRERPE